MTLLQVPGLILLVWCAASLVAGVAWCAVNEVVRFRRQRARRRAEALRAQAVAPVLRPVPGVTGPYLAPNAHEQHHRVSAEERERALNRLAHHRRNQ